MESFLDKVRSAFTVVSTSSTSSAADASFTSAAAGGGGVGSTGASSYAGRGASLGAAGAQFAPLNSAGGGGSSTSNTGGAGVGAAHHHITATGGLSAALTAAAAQQQQLHGTSTTSVVGGGAAPPGAGLGLGLGLGFAPGPAATTPAWADEGRTRACMNCDRPFGHDLPRCHCRVCERTVCPHCSSHYIPVSCLPPVPPDGEHGSWLRVCDFCECGLLVFLSEVLCSGLGGLTSQERTATFGYFTSSGGVGEFSGPARPGLMWLCCCCPCQVLGH
jgi:hypothetical protein